jgi:acetylornithine deacetylase
VCPGEASFGIDVRTVPGMTQDQLKRELGEFFAELMSNDSDLDVTFEQPAELAWVAPCEINPDHPVARAARSAARDVLDRDVPFGMFPAGTDGGIWASAGMPTLPAFGPGLLTLAHRPDEYVVVDEILEASRIYALTALRFAECINTADSPAPRRVGLSEASSDHPQEVSSP